MEFKSDYWMKYNGRTELRLESIHKKKKKKKEVKFKNFVSKPI